MHTQRTWSVTALVGTKRDRGAAKRNRKKSQKNIEKKKKNSFRLCTKPPTNRWLHVHIYFFNDRQYNLSISILFVRRLPLSLSSHLHRSLVVTVSICVCCFFLVFVFISTQHRIIIPYNIQRRRRSFSYVIIIRSSSSFSFFSSYSNSFLLFEISFHTLTTPSTCLCAVFYILGNYWLSHRIPHHHRRRLNFEWKEQKKNKSPISPSTLGFLRTFLINIQFWMDFFDCYLLLCHFYKWFS